MERTVEFMYKLKKRLIHIIARHTGKTDDQVKLDSDRDYYMSAEEAKNYGLVDNVVESRKQLGPEMRPELLPPAGSGALPAPPAAKPD